MNAPLLVCLLPVSYGIVGVSGDRACDRSHRWSCLAALRATQAVELTGPGNTLAPSTLPTEPETAAGD
jgi:hypothetical protein